ncbi:signal peptidase I [Ilumatobacter sp.]|uniref:signal peptidase I n=1 Tax=Ilumatobacter sp. TaxID=1967498 RepID=UPI003B516000
MTLDADTSDPDFVDDEGAPPRPAARRDEPTSGARAFFDWVVVVAVALAVAFLVRGFLLAHYEVEGSSMDSTLTTGDRVFVNKLSYRLHDPNRGDVVVLHQINGAAERDLIKRVIALPGEVVEMVDCVVTITEVGAESERVLDEPYLDPDVVSSSCGGDFGPAAVPEEHVFVMGDNRSGSQDSRSPSVGPVSYDDIVGRAFVVFWPRSDWRWL